MKFDDYMAEQYAKDPTLKERIDKIKAEGDYFLEHPEDCPHDATVGEVGAPTAMCLDCRQVVPNTDFEEEAE